MDATTERWNAERERERDREREREREAERQTDRQRDRQTDRHNSTSTWLDSPILSYVAMLRFPQVKFA